MNKVNRVDPFWANEGRPEFRVVKKKAGVAMGILKGIVDKKEIGKIEHRGPAMTIIYSKVGGGLGERPQRLVEWSEKGCKSYDENLAKLAGERFNADALRTALAAGDRQ